MARSAAPKADGGKRKGRGAAAAVAPPLPTDPPRLLGPDAAPLPDATLNGDAWPAGSVLRVAGEEYEVVVNPPTITRVAVSGAPIVGCPLAPALDLQFAERGECEFEWQRRPAGTAGDDQGWAPVPAGGRSASYAPAPADVGHELRVIVTPGAPGGARGEPAAAAVAGAVEPGPASRAADERADAVPTWTTPPRLRVVTYNLLADQYAASDYAKAHLFNHCPPHHLDPAYRRSLAAQELLAYAGDILFLQEVDEKAFEGVLEPVLAAAGYDGRMTAKASTVREGSALFWRADRFKLVAWRTVVLKDLFGALWAAEEGEGCGSDHLALAARHAALLPALASSPALRDALAKVSTIAQVALLAPVEGGGGGDDGPILATNTHLFFHPAAPHIRTLHVAAMLAEAADVGARALAAGEIKEPATPLFCGDLNSDLNDGIPGTVELLREGALARGFWDWGLGAGFRYDDDGAAPSEGGPLPAPTRAAGDGLAPPT